jgi:hypothetical protein
MFLCIALDVAPAHGDPRLFRQWTQDIDRIAAADPDMVILARETEDGALAPGRLEAVVALPWLAGLLTRPILVASMPALHAVPFHIARALSAADFLSGGRAGWMPLTTALDGYDAAYGGPAHHAGSVEALAKADDFVRATQALWDSWDENALVLDKASGAYLDSDKVRRVAYQGPYFSTMGPLNAARPPQGYPLLVRDLDDIGYSGVLADILIGGRAMIENTSLGVRLLKTPGPNLQDNLAAVAAGAAEGLHLMGDSAIETLATLRARHPRMADAKASGRERLGLRNPLNPYAPPSAF